MARSRRLDYHKRSDGVEIESGMKCSWVAKRKDREGIIAYMRVKSSRATKRFNRQFNLDLPDIKIVGQVVESGSDSYWELDVEMIKIIGDVDPVAHGEAEAVVDAVIQSKRERKHSRLRHNIEVIDEKDLRDLRAGDQIEVNFRQGWSTRTFSHFTSSGKVAFKAGNRRGCRYVWPKHVRVIITDQVKKLRPGKTRVIR